MPVDIVKKTPDLNDQELLKLFKNASRYKREGKRTAEASRILSAISAEWKRRLEAAERGYYKATLPKIGMLRTLGYSVGENGVKTKLRREILDYIMEGPLPIVESPAYTFEWGEPLTNTRFHKLTRSLRAFIDGAENREGMEKSMIEWMEDLEYLESMYC